MTAATLTREAVARLRTAGLRLPRVLPGQEWRPATGAEQHLLSEARRLDRIRQTLLEEIGRLRAQVPRQRAELDVDARIAGCPLTVGQLEALTAAAHGETVEATAHRLHTSIDSVKHWRRRGMEALGARSVMHAVALAVAAGWIPMGQLPQDGELS